MAQVYRFDADGWCVVYCREHSDVVQMTSNLADEEIANKYAQMIRDDGGHVFRVVRAGVLVAALDLIHDPNRAGISGPALDPEAPTYYTTAGYKYQINGPVVVDCSPIPAAGSSGREETP